MTEPLSKTESKPVITSIRLSREAVDQVDRLANIAMRSRSNMIELIIFEWLQQNGEKQQ